MKSWLGGILILNTSLAIGTPKPLITKLTVHKNRVDITIDEEFKKNYLKDDFFVQYDEEINLEKFDYSIVTLPFLTNVLSLVWISGKDYTIEEMDIEVYESFERLRKVFEIMYPKTPWTGQLIPKKFVSHTPVEEKDPGAIALLFSSGVDSTASSFYHRDRHQLLITAWGQSGLPLDERKLWEKHKQVMIDFAEQYGHENTFFTSNYYYFLNLPKLKNLSPEILTWRIHAIEDIGWAGLAAPILLTRGIKILRIASSMHWNQKGTSAMNPYIDGNIRFAGLEFHQDLFSMSRLGKIEYIVKLCDQGITHKPHFIICQKPDIVDNCSACEKCYLTIALLIGAGANPQEYGFSLSREKASEVLQEHLNDDLYFQDTTLLDYAELQKRIRKNRSLRMRWLAYENLKEKKVLTKHNVGKVNYDVLHTLFPHIRSETT
jgi:hypothetical protein